MIQKLTERYIIDLMREEWTNKVQSLLSEKKVKKSAKPTPKGKRRLEDLIDVDGDGQPEMVIDRGLKVTSKSGPFKGTDYTVEDVDQDQGQVTLSRADAQGKIVRLTVSFDELRSYYTM